jgi:hypothetical protein
MFREGTIGKFAVDLMLAQGGLLGFWLACQSDQGNNALTRPTLFSFIQGANRRSIASEGLLGFGK